MITREVQKALRFASCFSSTSLVFWLFSRVLFFEALFTFVKQAETETRRRKTLARERKSTRNRRRRRRKKNEHSFLLPLPHSSPFVDLHLHVQVSCVSFSVSAYFTSVNWPLESWGKGWNFHILSLAVKVFYFTEIS